MQKTFQTRRRRQCTIICLCTRSSSSHQPLPKLDLCSIPPLPLAADLLYSPGSKSLPTPLVHLVEVPEPWHWILRGHQQDVPRGQTSPRRARLAQVSVQERAWRHKGPPHETINLQSALLPLCSHSSHQTFSRHPSRISPTGQQSNQRFILRGRLPFRSLVGPRSHKDLKRTLWPSARRHVPPQVEIKQQGASCPHTTQACWNRESAHLTIREAPQGFGAPLERRPRQFQHRHAESDRPSSYHEKNNSIQSG